MTCPVANGKISIPDDRFTKLYDIICNAYGRRCESIKYTIDPETGQFQVRGGYSILLSVSATKPDLWRGVGAYNNNQPIKDDPSYYACKPRAIKTHMIYMERLLNFNVENNILLTNQ